jgi:hypothetical protein
MNRNGLFIMNSDGHQSMDVALFSSVCACLPCRPKASNELSAANTYFKPQVGVLSDDAQVCFQLHVQKVLMVCGQFTCRFPVQRHTNNTQVTHVLVIPSRLIDSALPSSYEVGLCTVEVGS